MLSTERSSSCASWGVILRSGEAESEPCEDDCGAERAGACGCTGCWAASGRAANNRISPDKKPLKRGSRAGCGRILTSSVKVILLLPDKRACGLPLGSPAATMSVAGGAQGNRAAQLRFATAYVRR